MTGTGSVPSRSPSRMLNRIGSGVSTRRRARRREAGNLKQRPREGSRPIRSFVISVIILKS
jgi:hypothetical protein